MNRFFYSHGRTALYEGIRKYNLQKKDTVLIPDYLCEIVELTLNSLGLKTLKYKIKDNFKVDITSLQKKIEKDNPKALIFVNYFGFPQKLKTIKKICKKKKILLIEDNSHGYEGIFNNQKLGTRGDFGFSSPRKIFNIYSGGVLYLKKNMKIFLPEYRFSIFEYFSQKIKNVDLLRMLVKKYFLLKRDYSNPYLKRDNKGYNFKIDKYSLKKIKTVNIKKEKMKRFNNYQIWKKFLKRKKVKLIFSKTSKNLMIWCLPFYVKNSIEAKKWYDWGNKKGITIFSWPDLSFEIINNNKKCFLRWQRLVCIPLDMPSEQVKKICN